MNALNEFLERHKASQFNNNEMLFAGLKSGECVFANVSEIMPNSSSCGDLLGIYTIRLKHLHQYETAHAEKIREDVSVLCAELSKSLEERVQVWMFDKAPNFSITVFESVESRRILGCILAADKTRTNDNEWQKLWHKSEG